MKTINPLVDNATNHHPEKASYLYFEDYPHGIEIHIAFFHALTLNYLSGSNSTKVIRSTTTSGTG